MVEVKPCSTSGPVGRFLQSLFLIGEQLSLAELAVSFPNSCVINPLNWRVSTLLAVFFSATLNIYFTKYNSHPKC